jgi:thiol-disulfide isomerase/thioredoxin
MVVPSFFAAGLCFALYASGGCDAQRRGDSAAASTPRSASGCTSVRQRCLPVFDLVDLYGVAHPASGHSGNVVVMNFWATWCGPCVKEIPALSAVQTRYRAQGVEFYGLLTGDDTEVPEVIALTTDLGVSYPIALAAPAVLAAFDSPGELPSTFVFDRSGVLRAAHSGPLDEPALLAILEPLLARP